MPQSGRITIWTEPHGPGVPEAVLAALRSHGVELRTHEGAEAPPGEVGVLLRWAEGTDRAKLEACREALREGGALAAVLVAPGAEETGSGRPGPEDYNLFRAEPSWPAEAVAAIAGSALSCAGALAELERARRHLEDLAETQEDFVTVASHDLRTPVSTLRLLHDLFRSALDTHADRVPPKEASQFDEFLEIMARNLDKMEAFTNDILEAWRLYRGRPEVTPGPVGLNSVVEDIVAGLFPVAMKKDIALDLVPEEGLAPILAEPRRVGQVVANLVGNALKFAPQGGAVTVHTRAAEGGAVLEVADTGPGVAEEDREHLFERFRRGTARATGGEPSTGLGLYICREIVDLYGGRIWAEGPSVAKSAGRGPGSRFLVFWPGEEKRARRKKARKS
jgi:signal transduction histidine kinase